MELHQLEDSAVQTGGSSAINGRKPRLIGIRKYQMELLAVRIKCSAAMGTVSIPSKATHQVQVAFLLTGARSMTKPKPARIRYPGAKSKFPSLVDDVAIALSRESRCDYNIVPNRGGRLR